MPIDFCDFEFIKFSRREDAVILFVIGGIFFLNFVFNFVYFLTYILSKRLPKFLDKIILNLCLALVTLSKRVM